MNKNIIKNRFSRAIESYDNSAIAQKEICHNLFNLIKLHTPSTPKLLLEFGCGTGNLSRLLQEFLPQELILNDLCGGYASVLNHKLPQSSFKFDSGDARQCLNELKKQGKKFDLIASASALQWIENPIEFLKECLESLNPGGLLAISSFAPENIKEVTSISGEVLDYINKDEYKNELGDRCKILHLSTERIKLHFDSPYDILKHLKLSGVTASESTKNWTRKDLREFENNYTKLNNIKNSRCPITYQPLYLVCQVSE